MNGIYSSRNKIADAVEKIYFTVQNFVFAHEYIFQMMIEINRTLLKRLTKSIFMLTCVI